MWQKYPAMAGGFGGVLQGSVVGGCLHPWSSGRTQGGELNASIRVLAWLLGRGPCVCLRLAAPKFRILRGSRIKFGCFQQANRRDAFRVGELLVSQLTFH